MPRFVFISAHDYGFPVRNLVSGYYDGKQNAEAAIAELYGDNGVVLRASAVYGKRILPGKDGKTLPLDVCCTHECHIFSTTRLTQSMLM